MSDEERNEWISKVSRELGEEFDAVQILCTLNEDGLTKAYYKGSGNWYARQGMAHEFIEQDRGQVAANEISKIVIRTEPPEEAE